MQDELDIRTAVGYMQENGYDELLIGDPKSPVAVLLSTPHFKRVADFCNARGFAGAHRAMLTTVERPAPRPLSRQENQRRRAQARKVGYVFDAATGRRALKQRPSYRQRHAAARAARAKVSSAPR